jgi:hypothetical protein
MSKILALALAAGLAVGVALYAYEVRWQGAGYTAPESSYPGGGQGRVDVIARTGVYPASAGSAPPGAQAQSMASWGQGARGAAGYQDAGGSELSEGFAG